MSKVTIQSTMPSTVTIRLVRARIVQGRRIRKTAENWVKAGSNIIAAAISSISALFQIVLRGRRVDGLSSPSSITATTSVHCKVATDAAHLSVAAEWSLPRTNAACSLNRLSRKNQKVKSAKSVRRAGRADQSTTRSPRPRSPSPLACGGSSPVGPTAKASS